MKLGLNLLLFLPLLPSAASAQLTSAPKEPASAQVCEEGWAKQGMYCVRSYTAEDGCNTSLSQKIVCVLPDRGQQ